MYYIPKKSKYKHPFKNFKKRKKNIKGKLNKKYSNYIISKEYGFLTGNRIEALRKNLIKLLYRKKKIPSIIQRNISLRNTVSKKGILTRMGRGKGNIKG